MLLQEDLYDGLAMRVYESSEVCGHFTAYELFNLTSFLGG